MGTVFGWVFGLFFLWWLFFSDPHTFNDFELDELVSDNWNSGYYTGVDEICKQLDRDIYNDIEECRY